MPVGPAELRIRAVRRTVPRQRGRHRKLLAGHCQGIMTFEEANPEQCHRVRYEDLVTAPEETALAIFSFLGIEQVPGITQASFHARHAAGPGDQKIWFTGKIREDSIGRGVRVPAGKPPAPVREDINELLGRLDYRILDEKWNTAIGRADPRVRPERLPVPGQPPGRTSGRGPRRRGTRHRGPDQIPDR